jgi:outer membrane protein assembly factor BamB
MPFISTACRTDAGGLAGDQPPARHRPRRRGVWPWALLAVLYGCLGAADWPQWLGPDRNGVAPAEGLLSAWPKEGPKVLWRVPCGEGCATPVVAGGRLVLMDRADTAERIRCYAADSGRELWAVEYEETAGVSTAWGQGARSTPVISGGDVYAMGVAGRLTCVHLATGRVLWHTRLADFHALNHKDYGVYGSPLVEGDVVVAVGYRRQALRGLDRRTGRVVWQSLATDGYFHTPQAALLAGRRQVVVGVWRSLAGLDPHTGAVLWRHDHPKPIDALTTPVVHQDIVVFTGYGIPTYAIKVERDGDGFKTTELWRSTDVRPWFNAAVAHGGRLYVCNQKSGEWAGLACADIRTGAILWMHRIRGFGLNVAAWVLILGDKLLVAVEDGRLILGEDAAHSFRELAQAKVLDGTAYAMPAFADGRLYVRNFHELMCLQLTRES